MNTYYEQNEYILWTKWILTMNKMNTYYEQNKYILWAAKNLTVTSFPRRFLHFQAHLQYTLHWVITTKNVFQTSVRIYNFLMIMLPWAKVIEVYKEVFNLKQKLVSNYWLYYYWIFQFSKNREHDPLKIQSLSRAMDWLLKVFES